MPTTDHAETRLLREQLHELMCSGNAHADIDTVLGSFPIQLAGKRPANTPYTIWQLLEHMRLTVHDLLEFSTNSEYLAPRWPEDYWPSTEAPKTAEEWDFSVKALKADCKAIAKLATDSESNLYAQIPWGQGQTLLREILLAADHTSYHLGQIVLLRKQLGAWDE
jgi:uncharacterized damage-inducible protein DinB